MAADMNAGTQARRSPLSGLLTSPGTAMVWLMMHQKPVPDAPPEELKPFVGAVYDHHGRLIDWRFRPPSDGSHSDLSDSFEHVHLWRELWLTERAVADAATLRTILSWADRHVDVSALHVLGVADAQLDSEAVPRACMQAKNLRTAMAKGDRGVAIVDADTQRVVRGFAPPAEPTEVLALARSQLELTADALWLRIAGEAHGPLTGWRDTGSDLTALIADGPLSLDAGTAELLRQVAPARGNVVVHTVELAKLFAPVLASLIDMTELAGGAHHPLYVRRGLV